MTGLSYHKDLGLISDRENMLSLGKKVVSDTLLTVKICHQIYTYFY